MKKFTLFISVFSICFINSYSQNIWKKTNCPDTLAANSVTVNSNGDIFAATQDGILRSTDDGFTWLEMGLHTGIRLVFIDPDGKIYLTTNQQGPVLYSADNGSSWNPIGLTSWQNSIAVNSSGHIFAGTDNFGVYRTTNSGGNWIPINNGITDVHVTSLIIDSSQNILAGTIFDGVFRSSDNGESWIHLGPASSHITTLAINSEQHIFAGTSGHGILRSTDNGVNWFEINEGIEGENLWIRSILICSNNHIFIGTAGGALRSTDNGNTWLNFNEGLTTHDVRSVSYSCHGQIIAGTNVGVFSRSYDLSSVNTTQPEIISAFTVYQNYPNPFNPSTKIKYQLPVQSKVVIKIYNIVGMEVMDLLNQEQNPGIYEVEFNGKNLASGTYLCKISSNDDIQIKKMILLK